MQAYLVFGVGNKQEYERRKEAYAATKAILTKSAPIYGLPLDPSQLDADQQEILQGAHPDTAMEFRQPESIFFRCTVDFFSNVPKTVNNFVTICKGGRMCKSAPNKPLHYKGLAMHRVVSNFIAQGGDVTGKGQGESIYGGSFADEKEGLKMKMERGVVAMANAGKNSNTSQFFVVLTDDPKQLAKLSGKYVAFGRLVAESDADALIDRLNQIGSASGTPQVLVWIEDCGVV